MEVRPNINLDEIPDAVRRELEKSTASQLDLLIVRSNLAENKAETKKVKALAIENRDHLKDLTEKFYVQINNGRNERKHISDLILDMYERETNRRHFDYFKNLISRHRKLVVGLIMFSILSNVVLRNQIRDLLEWISQHVFDLLKLIF